MYLFLWYILQSAFLTPERSHPWRLAIETVMLGKGFYMIAYLEHRATVVSRVFRFVLHTSVRDPVI